MSDDLTPDPDAPVRRSGRPPAGRAPAPAPASGGGLLGDQQTVIGLILIGVAILLGVFLFAKGFGDDGSPVASDDGSGSTVTTTTADLDAAPTVDLNSTSTTAAVRPTSEVKVIVANASGVVGAATTLGDTLTSDGYAVVDTTNAAAVSATKIYYVGDYEPEALALATALGLESSAVAELPDPSPVEGSGEANLLVLIGPDLDTSSSASSSDTSASSSASSTTTTAG